MYDGTHIVVELAKPVLPVGQDLEMIVLQAISQYLAKVAVEQLVYDLALLEQKRNVERIEFGIKSTQYRRRNKRQVNVAQLDTLDHLTLAAQLRAGVNLQGDATVGALLELLGHEFQRFMAGIDG